MDRFLRTALLIGKEQHARICSATVAIIGLGAVGSYATEALARAGVGTFILADFDTVKKSNINRQLFALGSTVGRKKIHVAKERVADINPQATVKTYEMLIDDSNIECILHEKPDVIIDAVDSVNPKVKIIHAALTYKIPIISSMGAALRTDPFKITAGDLFKTRGCPLALRMRKRLRKLGHTHGVLAVYSHEKNSKIFLPPDQNTDQGEFKQGRSRNVLGSLPTITGIFGLITANYAIDYLAHNVNYINEILNKK